MVDSPTGGGCSDKHGRRIAAPLLEADSLGARILVNNQIRQYKSSAKHKEASPHIHDIHTYGGPLDLSGAEKLTCVVAASTSGGWSLEDVPHGVAF